MEMEDDGFDALLVELLDDTLLEQAMADAAEAAERGTEAATAAAVAVAVPPTQPPPPPPPSPPSIVPSPRSPTARVGASAAAASSAEAAPLSWPENVPRYIDSSMSVEEVNRYFQLCRERNPHGYRRVYAPPPGRPRGEGFGRPPSPTAILEPYARTVRGKADHLRLRTDEEVMGAVRVYRGQPTAGHSRGGQSSTEDPWRHFVDLVGPIEWWPFFIRDAFWSGHQFDDHRRMTVVHFAVLNGVNWDSLDDCLAFTLGGHYFQRQRRAQCLARYRYFYEGGPAQQRERRSRAWSYNVTTRQLCTLNDEPCDRRGNLLPRSVGGNAVGEQQLLPGDE